MRKLIYNYALFLFLLPVFYVLHHNNELFGFIPVQYSLIALLASAAIIGATYLFIKNSIFTFLFALLILYFGPAHDFFKKISNNYFLSSYKWFLPLLLVIIIIIAFVTNRNEERRRKTHIYLNLLMSILLIIEVISFGLNSVRYFSNRNLIYPDLSVCENYKTPSQDSLPDIYFIVLDAYTNSKTLHELWNYNNDSIERFLLSKGFYINQNSQANYNFTPLSLSSTFNLNYLPNSGSNNPSDLRIPLRAINSMSENELTCILKKSGYSIQYIIPFENKFKDAGLVKEFEGYGWKQLYNQTLPSRLQRDILWNFKSVPHDPKQSETYRQFARRAKDAENIISSIRSSASLTSPKFVYAHFMVTHQPHLFQSNGTLRNPTELIDQENLFETYTDQVTYANAIIHEIVDQIQQHNKKNTIIIIEGDHGFRDLPAEKNEYQFPNFSAIYFPNQDYNGLPIKTSPVNTFRIVLNHYFGQNLPLLKDSSIFVKY